MNTNSSTHTSSYGINEEGLNLFIESTTIPNNDDWKNDLSTTQRKRVNRQARKYGIHPFVYHTMPPALMNILISINSDEGNVAPATNIPNTPISVSVSTPDWSIGMSANARRNVRNKAAKHGVTPEFYLANRDKLAKRLSDANTQQQRAQSKNYFAKQAKELNRESLSNIKVPPHLSVITWDSKEMEELMQEDEGLVASKAIANQLINGSNELREETFIQNGQQMSQAAVLNLVTKVMQRDKLMLPTEDKFRLKVGNFASLPFYKWADKVFKLFQPVHWNPEEEVLQEAYDWLLETLQQMVKDVHGTEVLKPLAVNEALDRVTKGRNSGYPFFTPKWFDKQEVLTYYVRQAICLLAGDEIDDYRILFKRVVNNGEEAKMRAVECPPKSEAIAAKCFTDRFIEMFKQSSQFCGFKGGANLGEEAAAMLNEHEYLISSDFSSFDANCKHFIPIIFQMMKELTGHEHDAYFDSITKYYMHSKLITPLGIISSEQPNGLNSGDGWTSVIGTLSNALANKYCELQMGIKFDVWSFGDDCVIGTNEPFDTRSYEAYMKDLGMECNQDKQEVSQGDTRNCNFLGYYYFYQDLISGTPVNKLCKFPIMRILPRLMYTETPMRLKALIDEIEDQLTDEEIKAIVAAKRVGINLLAYMQRLDNLRNHDAYEDFVELFCQLEPNGMNSDLIMPFAKLRVAIRGLRFNRGEGIFHSPTLQLLYKREGKDLNNPVPNHDVTAIVVRHKDDSAIVKYNPQINGGVAMK